ncbi:MAG: polysaccharide export protein [Calditrichaeota bacterium]|nr:MAG: polysaccharide export protein [Calditrichota bacterium]
MVQNNAAYRILPPLLLAVVLFSSCSHGLTTAGISQQQEPQYRIRPGDILEVRFEYYPDFNQTLIVQPDGQVSLYAVGDLDIADLSVVEVRKTLTEKYSEILAMPKIEVKVLESQRFTVYVGGEIKHPGVVKFKSSLTVAQSIVLAGGLRDLAAEYRVLIFRNRGPKGVKTYELKLKPQVSGSNLYRKFRLAPYDVLFVLRASDEKRRMERHI